MFLKTIWIKLRGLFTKRPRSTENIISEERAILADAIDIVSLYAKIDEISDDTEKKDLIKKIARQEVAKDLIEFVENDSTITEKKKKGRKKIYELHELRAELQKLEEQKVTLRLSETRIRKTLLTDTSSFDSRIDKLYSILSRNKKKNKVEVSNSTIFEFDTEFKLLDKLLSDKSTSNRHRNRVREKRKTREFYEYNIKKELNNLDALIGQNKLDDAKSLINRLSISIQPDYKKGIERLTKAKAELREKELKEFRERQKIHLKQQYEEAQRIKVEQEKIIEEQNQAIKQAEAKRKLEEGKKLEKERKLRALLTKKFNWREYEKILKDNGIVGFYHFTDRSNLTSIRENGGLFSWYYCDQNNIKIPMPGGSINSRQNDATNGKKDFVRVAINKKHPMLYIAHVKEHRILSPVWLDIDIEVAYFEHTEFSDKNAAAFAAYTPKIGKDVSHLMNIRFDILKKAQHVEHFGLEKSEQPYNQAEVLVKTWIPLEYIKNIDSIS